MASAGAIAVAVGPLVGGLCTTYLSWRVVFFGRGRHRARHPGSLVADGRLAAVPGVRLDPVGTLLSAAGLGLFVYGVIRSGTWGLVQPKPDAPTWLGTSPVIWLLLGGAGLLAFFLCGKAGSSSRPGPPPRYAMLRRPRLQAGLTSFFFQFLLQAGLFFVIPLFLSVALGLSAVATGVRLLPLSLTLLAAAVGVPKLFPRASPRRVVRFGFALMFLGIVVLLERSTRVQVPRSSPGHCSSQASASAPGLAARRGDGVGCPGLSERRRGRGPEHRDEPRRIIGTALAGAVLIGVLTTTFLGAVAANPAVP